MNRKGLAESFQVSLPTVDEWVRRGCPVEQAGGSGRDYKFSLPSVVAWRVADLQSRLRGAAEKDENFKDAELRKVKAEADLKEMEVAKKRGDLIDARAVRKVWTDALAVIKTRVLSISVKRAREFSEETDWTVIQQVLDADCRECLDAIHKYDPAASALGDLEGSDVAEAGPGDRPTTTQTDDQPVGRPASHRQPRKKQRARPVAHRSDPVSA